MIQDMINSDNMNSTESTIPNIFKVFLLLEDRGRPSDLDICTVTQYLSTFAKYFIGFRKRENMGEKYLAI